MSFYDTNIERVQTAAQLRLRGLNPDNSLVDIGIFPIDHVRPAFDSQTQELIPAGAPVPSDSNPRRYTQHYDVVDLGDERLATNLEARIEAQRKAAHAAADAAVASYMSQFSDVEITTWPTQQREVEAWQLDNHAPTPMLDSLAKVRGITRDEMLEKASVKVGLFSVLAPFVVGKQQAYEDQIKAIGSDESKSVVERLEALNALEFVYELPSA